MKMTIADVTTWIGGKLETGAGDTRVERVSIDSRTTERGDLFFAIRGPRHDGHQYVGQALDRGALGVVVSETVSSDGAAAKIRVEDTTRALQDLAAAVREKSGIRVVAITGSMGKTTTKEAAAAALRSQFRVLKSERNLNNLYGVPLSVLKHRDEEVAVLELGMSAPGEIARLREIVRPDVAVLTNIAEVHREFFPSLEAIARAKGELFEGLGESAVAVVNGDDPLVREQARRFPGRRIRYGLQEGVDIVASGVTRTARGLRFIVHYEGQEVDVQAPLYGRHNAYNLLAALAVAAALGLPLAPAAQGLSELGPAPHRGERLRFRDGFMIIDETYNSNPAALSTVLDSFAEEPATRRIAVLGDMLELGEGAERAHLESGAKAARSGLDRLVGVGPLGARIVEGARRAGMDESRLVCVEGAEQAGDWIARWARVGDVYLLKASRGVGLERALEVLESRFKAELD